MGMAKRLPIKLQKRPSITQRNFCSGVADLRTAKTSLGVGSLAFVGGLVGAAYLLSDFIYADSETYEVKEKNTGFVFPKHLHFSDLKKHFQLVSVGVRTITFMKFKTYALAFYLPDDNRYVPVQDLCKFKKSTTEELLQKDSSLFNSVIDNNPKKATDKVIRIISSRSVRGAHLAKAFADHLTPRLQSIIKENNVKDYDMKVKGIIDQLNECLPAKRPLDKGVIVDFVMLGKEGTTIVYINGEKSGLINSPEFGKAFTDIYLGPNTKTPDVKKEFAAQMKNFLESVCKK